MKELQPKRGKPVSVEPVIVMFGMFGAFFNRKVFERGLKL